MGLDLLIDIIIFSYFRARFGYYREARGKRIMPLTPTGRKGRRPDGRVD